MNTNTKILLVITLFIIYYLVRGRYMCPCPYPGNNFCYRTEMYGLQMNHLLFYIIIGYLFPKYFLTWQILGICWELIEFLPTYYPHIFLPYIGGCIQLDKRDDFYVNIVDRWLPRSDEHFWHPKLSDILLNITGFMIGYFIIRKQVIAKFL